jgi:7-cyano-7-deazaguanine synthase
MKAILLYSGGLDSTTALAYYKKLGFNLSCITFNYGQKNKFEIQAAKSLTKYYNISEHIIINIDRSIFNSVSSLNSKKHVEEFESYNPYKNYIPTTYLPSRNIIFLSYATAVAESRQISNIIFSANKNDINDYPDCSIEFVEKFNSAINKGTHIGKKEGITILTPFIDKTKSEIIELGLSLTVDYANTQTCYNPTKLGSPCRKCDACLLRESSFINIGLMDPILNIGK